MIDQKNSPVETTGISISGKPIVFGTNGIALQGTLYMPPGASENNQVPGAVICHGYGGGQDSFVNSGLELAAGGVSVLTFDFRGHGSSGGKLDGSVVDDIMDAWEYLRNRPEIDRKRMGLIGHSMGAFSAIMAAGKLGKAKVLVTLSCPGELSSTGIFNPRHIFHPVAKFIAKSIFQFTAFFYKMQVRADWKKFIEFWPKMKPSQSLADLKECSKLFVFCLDDIVAPSNRFVYSYTRASEPKQMMVTTGNHNTPWESPSLRKQWQKWTINALHSKHMSY
jgi:pimeloyl-ACP methyl ester carboxylesterase